MNIIIPEFWGGFCAGALVMLAVIILLAMWAARRKAKDIGGRL